MQIAAQHTEAISQRSGIGVKEGFFFNGIALHAAYISPRHIKRSTLIEADFADAGLAIGNGTAMSAGKTTQPIAIKFFIENSFANVFVENVAKGGHEFILPPATSGE